MRSLHRERASLSTICCRVCRLTRSRRARQQIEAEMQLFVSRGKALSQRCVVARTESCGFSGGDRNPASQLVVRRVPNLDAEGRVRRGRHRDHQPRSRTRKSRMHNVRRHRARRPAAPEGLNGGRSCATVVLRFTVSAWCPERARELSLLRSRRRGVSTEIEFFRGQRAESFFGCF